MKKLISTAIGVAVRSPRRLIHVIPSMKAGATQGETFEALTVGFVAAGLKCINFPNLERDLVIDTGD